jgi:hypothetical protein
LYAPARAWLSPVLEDLRIVSVVIDRGRKIVDGTAEVF